MPTVQIKRGLKANLPTSSLLAGEQFATTDRHTLHIAADATTTYPIVPPIDDLTTLSSVEGAADLLLIHDASAALEKKITFDNFKIALNIPSGSTDEKCAVVSGGTSGFLWGTTGADGILRMSSSMTWTKDSGNAFVTLAVGAVDCGTF